MDTTGSPEIKVRHDRRRWLIAGLIVLTFAIGAFVGQMVGGGQFVRAAVQTDATPESLSESEREELNRLRTAVAEATACATATPTTDAELMASPVAVEPLAIGTTVQTAGDWEVTVKGISIPAADFKETPTGRYLQVEITVNNLAANGGRYFGFGNWALVDDQGRQYELAHGATMDVSGTYYRGFGSGAEKTFRIVYDVATDAGTSFTYVYLTDPTIQYALTLQAFG